MNNEELKKKIVEILNEAFTERDVIPVHTAPDGKKTALPDELCKIFNNIVLQAVIPYFADALIAAGIGDVKEAEHRTFVMQLALKNACEIVFSQEIDDEDWDDVIFNYKKEKGIREIGITPNILYDYLKEQAEKELAEENGGKKKV